MLFFELISNLYLLLTFVSSYAMPIIVGVIAGYPWWGIIVFYIVTLIPFVGKIAEGILIVNAIITLSALPINPFIIAFYVLAGVWVIGNVDAVLYRLGVR